jgi:hypothetical protein
MDVPHRTFSDVYRGQVIEVLVVSPQEVEDFNIDVKVIMQCQTPVPTLKICNLGYESLDEARHAGIAIGRRLIDTLTPDAGQECG